MEIWIYAKGLLQTSPEHRGVYNKPNQVSPVSYAQWLQALIIVIQSSWSISLGDCFIETPQVLLLFRLPLLIPFNLLPTTIALLSCIPYRSLNSEVNL